MQEIAIPSHIAGVFVYLLVLLPVIIAEHLTLGKLLNGKELMRRAIGIVTVWALMPLVALFAPFDWFTWGVMAIGFFAAGIVLILFHNIEDVLAENRHVEDLRQQFRDITRD